MSTAQPKGAASSRGGGRAASQAGNPWKLAPLQRRDFLCAMRHGGKKQGRGTLTKRTTIFEYDDIARIAIDEDGHMNWNGEAVLARQEVKLSRWVSVSIVAAGGSALATAAIDSGQIFRWLPAVP